MLLLFLTVSQAMFDSARAIATLALFTAQYTKMLLYFDAYGLIVTCLQSL